MPYKDKKKQNKFQINWRRQRRLEAIKMKGGKCSVCGYNKSTSALGFHHNKGKKEFGLNSCKFNKSWDRLLPELEKCILVCANCHMEIHGQPIPTIGE